MVENENLLLWYKNEEKYINDTTIAALMQDMLNKAAGKPLFKVYLESKATLKLDEAYTCTLKTRIEPYMLKGAHCENVYVRLTVKYPIENEQEKIQISNIVTKCLGFITGGFKCSDRENQGEDRDYTFCSNFTKDETGTPENLNSHYTGSITLKGNMHITRGDGGILGDMVENYILIAEDTEDNGDDLVPPDGGGFNSIKTFTSTAVANNKTYKEWPVVGRTVEGSWQAVTDNPIKAGSFIPDTEYNAVSNAKSLIILYRNDYICNLLRDFAQGLLGENNEFIDKSTGKPVLTLKEKYPDGRTVQDTYYIYEIKETREAGSYMCLSIALIKRS